MAEVQSKNGLNKGGIVEDLTLLSFLEILVQEATVARILGNILFQRGYQAERNSQKFKRNIWLEATRSNSEDMGVLEVHLGGVHSLSIEAYALYRFKWFWEGSLGWSPQIYGGPPSRWYRHYLCRLHEEMPTFLQVNSRSAKPDPNYILILGLARWDRGEIGLLGLRKQRLPRS